MRMRMRIAMEATVWFVRVMPPNIGRVLARVNGKSRL